MSEITHVSLVFDFFSLTMKMSNLGWPICAVSVGDLVILLHSQENDKLNLVFFLGVNYGVDKALNSSPCQCLHLSCEMSHSSGWSSSCPLHFWGHLDESSLKLPVARLLVWLLGKRLWIWSDLTLILTSDTAPVRQAILSSATILKMRMQKSLHSTESLVFKLSWRK